MMYILERHQAPPSRPDESRAADILGATLTVTIAALITTIARMYVRMTMIRSVSWDDYAILFTMALCFAGQCLIFPQVKHGAGRHIEYIPPTDIPFAVKMNFITQPIYVVAICFVKISVGFFLLRIAVLKFYRRLITSIMVFMAVYSIVCVFTLLLQCTDIRVLWDHTVQATCWPVTTIRMLAFTNIALNITTDLAFAIFIPIPMLWHVQMNKRHKASLICILSLGIFATAACFVKLSYIMKYGRYGDWLWDSSDLTIWTVIECNIGIVAANLPCLKPLVRSALGATYGRGSRKNTVSKYGSRFNRSSGNQRSNKSYASMNSRKRAEKDLEDYNTSDGVYMLTTVGAENETREVICRCNSGQSSPTRGVMEDTICQGQKAVPFNRLGGIEVTTKIDVTD